jgi:hypothetical protein
VPPANARDAEQQTSELISASEGALDQFEEIEPPGELEGRLEAYLDQRRKALELLRRGREAAQRQDRRAYSAALERALRETPRRQALARGLGFRECTAGGAKGGGRRAGKRS